MIEDAGMIQSVLTLVDMNLTSVHSHLFDLKYFTYSLNRYPHTLAKINHLTLTIGNMITATEITDDLLTIGIIRTRETIKTLIMGADREDMTKGTMMLKLSGREVGRKIHLSRLGVDPFCPSCMMTNLCRTCRVVPVFPFRRLTFRILETTTEGDGTETGKRSANANESVKENVTGSAIDAEKGKRPTTIDHEGGTTITTGHHATNITTSTIDTTNTAASLPQGGTTTIIIGLRGVENMIILTGIVSVIGIGEIGIETGTETEIGNDLAIKTDLERRIGKETEIVVKNETGTEKGLIKTGAKDIIAEKIPMTRLKTVTLLHPNSRKYFPHQKIMGVVFQLPQYMAGNILSSSLVDLRTSLLRFVSSGCCAPKLSVNFHLSVLQGVASVPGLSILL